MNLKFYIKSLKGEIHLKYDLLIKNGKLINVLENSALYKPWECKDIGIKGERIIEIGHLNESESRETINAKDYIVSPGFIDIHSHSDTYLLINPKAESAEIQEYVCNSEAKLITILEKLIGILREKNIKYIEAYISAYKPNHQKVFYQAGFRPTGYFPMYDTALDGMYEDAIVMVWLPEGTEKMLTKKLEFTPLSWKFMQHFMDDLGLKGISFEVDRGHVCFNMD